MFGVTLGISVPGFWVGLMLIELFAVNWGVLPAGRLRLRSSTIPSRTSRR